MRVVVTGAAGFVGKALCPLLVQKGHQVRAVVRNVHKIAVNENIETFCLGEIGAETDWAQALLGQDVVIHLASRAHIKDISSESAEVLFSQTNVEGTIRLVECAIQSGVKRFVYISSVKAMGERSESCPLDESTLARPEDHYGRTKLLAEEKVLEMAVNSGMEVVIFRPPLIYGPGVKGNFLELMILCDLGFPLPFKKISNKRSLLFLGNFTDLLVTMLDKEIVSGERFFISDGEGVSTTELVKGISLSLGKKPKLFFSPLWLLRGFSAIIGKTPAIERLTSSLEIDGSKVKQMLSWTPPFNMTQGLEITAKWFQNRKTLY